MMKRIALWVLVFALAACTRSYSSRQLDVAESIIQSQPDSALRVLSRMDTSLLATPREHARFSLLYSMALDKNYIDTTDLRIIAPAVDYFTRKGNAREKMLAWYYQGRILQNSGHDEAAMNNILNALTESEKIEAGRYSGLIYTMISDLCGKSYCWEEEREYLTKAKNAFLQVGDTVSELNIASRLAMNSFNRGFSISAIRQFDSLEIHISRIPLLHAALLADRAYVKAYPDVKDYNSSLDDFQKALSMGFILSLKSQGMYAYVLEKCGFQEASDTVYRHLSEQSNEGRLLAKHRQIDQMEASGRYQEAYKVLKESVSFQNEEVNRLLSQSLFRSQRDYYELQQQQLRTQKERQSFFFLSLLLALALIGSIIGYFVSTAIKHHREKEAQMDRLAESLQLALGSEREKSSLHEQENQRLREQFNGLYAVQIEMLESTYREYEQARRTGAGQKELYDKLLGIIHEIKGDDSKQHLFEKLIDQKNDNVMTRLREECPDLPKNDRMLFAYTVAGFDKTTICMLLGNISPEALNMRRSRLRKYLRTQAPPSLDLFLRKITLN